MTITALTPSHHVTQADSLGHFHVSRGGAQPLTKNLTKTSLFRMTW